MVQASGSPTGSTHRSRLWGGIVLCLVLAACGGGGGGGGSSPDLPELVLSAPTTQVALCSPISFSANASSPSFSYLWDFGDGTTSTSAAPTHTYARAGVFSVRLSVSDDAGGRRTSTASVAVADFAIVAGRSCTGSDHSGWCWQRPLPQGNNIIDYVFVDDTRGWAVGEGGTVMMTVNGGVSWNRQATGTQLALGQVTFVSPLIGWVAGSYGELLKTADGGSSWQRVSFGRNEAVQTIGTVDANTAWVTTYFGNAFLTTNGGSTWRQVTAPNAYQLTFVSGSDIWALPQFFDAQPSLQHSLDGGTTWSSVALPPIEPGLAGYSSKLEFFDASHALLTGYESGYADADPLTYVSRQTLRITADGGASWQPVALPPAPGVNASYRLADATTVIAVSLYAYTVPLYRTSDAGASWQAIPVPSDTYAVGFRAYSAQRLLYLDSFGRAFLSIDGGATWLLRSANGEAAAPITSVWFFDSREGLATAGDGTSLRTADGGQNWVLSGTPTYGWRRLQFVADASVGWVISDQGTIYRSTDKGHVWQAPVPQTSAFLYGVTDFHFVDAQHGWAITPYDYLGAGTVFRSADGGASWQAVAGTSSNIGFQSLRFADALHGVAVGPGGIAQVTVDGGTTWSPRPTGVASELRRVTFIDATTAVAVGYGGAIVRSTDSGQTWKVIASPTSRSLSDVRFVSASVGHAVGEGGTEIVSSDGGASWSVVATQVQGDLQSVFFLDEQTGWIAGSNGSILATATGGR
jgi:photosystem II stability/assembly factor-like uncharacterized protein